MLRLILLICLISVMSTLSSEFRHGHQRHRQHVSHKRPTANQIDGTSGSKLSRLGEKSEVPNARPPIDKRLFRSNAVEAVITRLENKIKDPTLRQIFANCFPSTLDTTVLYHKKINDTFPYTYIITGDIAAMWLRDSAYQVNPYVTLAKDDLDLRDLILGVINTQAEMINLYPYGNAFLPLKHWNLETKSRIFHSSEDAVTPRYDPTQVHEAKYELDSLASFLYLSTHFWEKTGDIRFLSNHNWLDAVRTVLKTMRAQQGGTIEVMSAPPYSFTRPTRTQSETTNLYGIGNPVQRCGLIRSFFRPSDDSTVFQYLIPANAMAVMGLEGVAKIFEMAQAHLDLASELKQLGREVRVGIEKWGIIEHKELGRILAYEVDCYGSHLLMDDGNFPSLLSLPFYGFISRTNPLYISTRKYILSSQWNPYYAFGKFPGVGSPHTGLQKSWHLAQAMEAYTSTNPDEIKNLLKLLRDTTAGTGLMHESYNVNNPNQYTRSWFAWANTFFGDLILYIEQHYPMLLEELF